MLIILNSSTYGKCFLNLCILFFLNIIFYLKKTLIQYSVNNFFKILMAEINKFSHYMKITLCPCHVNALSIKSQIVLCSAKFFSLSYCFFFIAFRTLSSVFFVVLILHFPFSLLTIIRNKSKISICFNSERVNI